MTAKKLLLAVVLLASFSALTAQDEMPSTDGSFRSLTPADGLEVGVDVGLPFIAGDIDAKFPGFGGGIHVRKAFDHIFSVRFKGLYGATENEETDNNVTRTAETTWISGSGELLITLNNLRFNKPYRKLNIYAIAGLGINSYETDFTNVRTAAGDQTDGTIDSEVAGHFVVGGGIAYRISPKFNIGLEHEVFGILGGERADKLDGDNNYQATVTTFRDWYHFPQLTLNFNLGQGKGKTEPLYWGSAMGATAAAIAALEARPVYDGTDTDGDGVIDAIDQEVNSPTTLVDTRGVARDLDGDKVLDYKDKEPYSPPGFTVDANGVAGQPKPLNEGDVNRIVDAKLANFKLPAVKSLADWFLPSVNFDLGSSKINYSEYEKLYSVAQVMKSNPDLRLVAKGYTDRTGGEARNSVLSYNRSKAVVDHLATQHGISADRLVLNYAGEADNIVPTNSANRSNRRVEFRGARDEKTMERPSGSFQGNKDSGY